MLGSPYILCPLVTACVARLRQPRTSRTHSPNQEKVTCYEDVAAVRVVPSGVRRAVVVLEVVAANGLVPGSSHGMVGEVVNLCRGRFIGLMRMIGVLTKPTLCPSL